jgi:hypothetical protein
MVDLMGDARARLAKEDAEAVWKYLQNFIDTDPHAEDILSDLDRSCDGEVDRHSLADFLRECGAESISSSVMTEVLRMAQRSGGDLKPYLSWGDFIDMLRPHRSRVPTPPLRESSLSRPSDSFHISLTQATQSFSTTELSSTSNHQGGNQDGGGEFFYRAEFPPGSIGLSFMNIEEQDGIVVTHCEGAALHAGVIAGDLIVEVNEEPLDADFTEDNLFDLLMELPRPISIGFRRTFDQSSSSASLTLREDHEEEEKERKEREELLNRAEQDFNDSGNGDNNSDNHNNHFRELDKDLSQETNELEQVDNKQSSTSSTTRGLSRDDVVGGGGKNSPPLVTSSSSSSSSANNNKATSSSSSKNNGKGPSWKQTSINMPRDQAMSLSLNTSDVADDRNLRFSITDDFTDDLPSYSEGLEFSPMVEEDGVGDGGEGGGEGGGEDDHVQVVDIDHSRDDHSLSGAEEGEEEEFSPQLLDSDNEKEEIEFSQVVGAENLAMNDDDDVDAADLITSSAALDHNSDNESVTSEVSLDSQDQGESKQQTASSKKKNKKKKKGKK